MATDPFWLYLTMAFHCHSLYTTPALKIDPLLTPLSYLNSRVPLNSGNSGEFSPEFSSLPRLIQYPWTSRDKCTLLKLSRIHPSGSCETQRWHCSVTYMSTFRHTYICTKMHYSSFEESVPPMTSCSSYLPLKFQIHHQQQTLFELFIC